jgi:hypothetical protein
LIHDIVDKVTVWKTVFNVPVIFENVNSVTFPQPP